MIDYQEWMAATMHLHHCVTVLPLSLCHCHCVTVSLCHCITCAGGPGRQRELIDYQEWVAATMHLHRVNNEKNLRIAFNHFDSDNSGFIDIEELADALGADLQVLKEILAEVDTNNVSGLYCALLHCTVLDKTVQNGAKLYKKSTKLFSTQTSKQYKIIQPSTKSTKEYVFFIPLGAGRQDQLGGVCSDDAQRHRVPHHLAPLLQEPILPAQPPQQQRRGTPAH